MLNMADFFAVSLITVATVVGALDSNASQLPELTVWGAVYETSTPGLSDSLAMGTNGIDRASLAAVGALDSTVTAVLTETTDWGEDYETSSVTEGYDPQTTETGELDAAAVGSYCPAGSYSPPGFGACVLCETGTYADTVQSTACKQCHPGQYIGTDGAVQCLQCPAGKFSPLNGSSACSSCPGWTGSSAGMAACVTCSSSAVGCAYADGSSCPMCGSACTLCGAGYYNDGSSNNCAACGPGKYLPGRGAPSAASCTDCFSGTYTRPTSTGLSACLQCAVGMPLPKNSKYLESGFDPLLCNWVCDAGFQTVQASPEEGSDFWMALSTSYGKQGYSSAAVVEMIRYRSDYCCDTSKVTAGRWRMGCTKFSAGTIEVCQSVENGQFVLLGGDSLNRCNDWVCNAGFYKLDSVCSAQPVCDEGFTYARGSGGLVLSDPSGMYSCMVCPVCADGSEAATPCNSTHPAVCRLCGGSRPYSVGGGACVKDPPVGFRGVKATLGPGARPVLTFDNRAFVWVPSTVFYSYVACANAGHGRIFTGGDAVCDLVLCCFIFIVLGGADQRFETGEGQLLRPVQHPVCTLEAIRWLV